ncbi:MAG: cytoplasmic protein [Deltaproteobacteria bacterium]|nr:cytoplasmic protein [Deltaproteobacteria bacterium]
MSEGQSRAGVEFKVDSQNLYREEIFTDLKVATVRRLTPVQEDGNIDPARPVLFVGQTSVLTQAGPLPVDAAIDASNLREALERFPAALNRAIEDMVAQMEELRRREATRIVVPGAATSKILRP